VRIIDYKRHLIVCLILFIAIISISSVTGIDYNDQVVDGLNSTLDIEQAFNDSQINNKSVLLIFDQDTCYYCDLFKQDVLSDEDVQSQLNENFIVVFVDINEQYTVAEQLQVMGTPTSAILDSNGQEIARIDGYVSSDDFLDAIKEI